MHASCNRCVCDEYSIGIASLELTRASKVEESYDIESESSVGVVRLHLELALRHKYASGSRCSVQVCVDKPTLQLCQSGIEKLEIGTLNGSCVPTSPITSCTSCCAPQRA